MKDFVPTRQALVKVKKQIIPRSEVDGELRPVSKGLGYFVTASGKFYRKYGEDKYVPIKSPIVRQTGGYRYVHLRTGEKSNPVVTCRAHKLVAQAWVSNPEGKPIVDHINNDKADNRAENLQWVTWSENTQKAVNDGLLKNDKGGDDSQSVPIVCYNPFRDELREYGSVCEAHRDLGVSKSTVLRQARHEHHTKHRSGYFFWFKDEVEREGYTFTEGCFGKS